MLPVKRLAYFLRRAAELLDPPAPLPARTAREPEHDKRDAEALLAEQLRIETDGRRQGFVPWNQRRPRAANIDVSSLRYLVDTMGEHGAAQHLIKLAQEAKGKASG